MGGVRRNRGDREDVDLCLEFDRSVSVEQEMRGAGGRVSERFKEMKSRGRIGRVG